MRVHDWHQRARAEEGMTLIEVMVAAMVLVVGILALLTTLTSSGALTSRSERESQAVDFAQQQVESLRSLPYASIALSTCSPGDATWSRLMTSSDAYYITPLATEAEVTPCSGKVVPVGTWQDDKLSTRGSVYRYVTQVSPNLKRIVVAVAATSGAGAFNQPVAVSTLVPDPDAGNSSGTLITGAGSPCFIVGLICLS